MRILIIADTYPHAYKTYYDTHFTALVDEGHDLRICALARPYYIEPDVDPESLRYALGKSTVYLPTLVRQLPAAAPRVAAAVLAHPVRTVSTFRKAMMPGEDLRRRAASFARAAMLQGEMPDLCMVHGLDSILWVPWLKQLYPSVPVMLYFHGSETPNRRLWSEERLRQGYGIADVVVTNSSSSARNVIGRGCPAEKLAVIPLGFRLEEYVPPAERSYRRDGTLRLFSAARQSPEKGHIYALRALKLLLDRGLKVHYTLTGEGPAHEDLVRFVAENALQPHVTFKGRLPRAAVPREMVEADVLLQPSLKIREWEENQACAVQEAMLMKTLVLTTTEGGVRECIAPEMMTYCVPQADPEAIATALLDIAQMPMERLQQLGETIREYAERNFEVHELNRRMIEVTLSRASSAASGPAPVVAH